MSQLWVWELKIFSLWKSPVGIEYWGSFTEVCSKSFILIGTKSNDISVKSLAKSGSEFIFWNALTVLILFIWDSKFLWVLPEIITSAGVELEILQLEFNGCCITSGEITLSLEEAADFKCLFILGIPKFGEMERTSFHRSWDIFEIKWSW